MRNHPILFSILASVFAALTLACWSHPEPTQLVDFGDGLLSMSISESWVPLRTTRSEALYEHPSAEEAPSLRSAQDAQRVTSRRLSCPQAPLRQLVEFAGV